MFWGLFKSEKEKVRDDIDKRIKEVEEIAKHDALFLQSIQRLDIKDGDILVLKHPYRLSRAAREHLEKAFKASFKGFGHNINAIVLEENMDIGVIGKGSGAILEKLEEIRCGIVDVETEIEKLNKKA